MLNETTCFQFPVLEKIAFPGKKTFGNLERNVVEKRQKESPQHSHYRFYHFLSYIFFNTLLWIWTDLLEKYDPVLVPTHE